MLVVLLAYFVTSKRYQDRLKEQIGALEVDKENLTDKVTNYKDDYERLQKTHLEKCSELRRDVKHQMESKLATLEGVRQALADLDTLLRTPTIETLQLTPASTRELLGSVLMTTIGSLFVKLKKFKEMSESQSKVLELIEQGDYEKMVDALNNPPLLRIHTDYLSKVLVQWNKLVKETDNGTLYQEKFEGNEIEDQGAYDKGDGDEEDVVEDAIQTYEKSLVENPATSDEVIQPLPVLKKPARARKSRRKQK